MNNQTVFRVMSKDVHSKDAYSVRLFQSSHSLAIWFLGRAPATYIVIKSDNDSDRLVVLKNFEMNALEAELNNA